MNCCLRISMRSGAQIATAAGLRKLSRQVGHGTRCGCRIDISGPPDEKHRFEDSSGGAAIKNHVLCC